MSQPDPKPNWLKTMFQPQGMAAGSFRYGVAFKIIATVVTILLIFAGVQIVFSYRTTSQNLQQESEHTLASNYLTYQTKIETESKAAEAIALSVADRADVQTLYLQGDREALYELLAPMFDELKERQIVHLYIENPDGTVFLRVHNPANFGDDITYRGTAKTALLEKRVTSGIEIGPSRLGVRAVVPMYASSGRFIGLVEVGMDFDESFVTSLKETTGADYTMWVSHKAASIPNLKPVEGSPNAPIEELFYYASTDPGLESAESDLYRSVLSTGEPRYVVSTENRSIPAIIFVTPLLGYNDKVLGLLQVSEPYTSNIQSQNEALFTTLVLVGGLTVLSIFLIWLVTSTVVLRPLNALSQVAQKQAAGDVNTRASLRTRDEFEQLAGTFNMLADTVHQERQTLEQRVAARTRDLEIVAEVGTATATVLESRRLLQEVTDLTKERFNLYHSHIYLLDDKAENLVLAAGAGEPGRVMVSRGHSIPLDREQSLVARAARERKGVTVNDVTLAPDFLANPLLPDTRSELAVPMIIGDKVVGVFDIQSDQVGRFTETDVNIQTTLAAQLATSIQNVLSFEQSRRQAELQSVVNVIGQKIQRTTSIEETLQTAIRELGTAVGASRVQARLQPTTTTTTATAD